MIRQLRAVVPVLRSPLPFSSLSPAWRGLRPLSTQPLSTEKIVEHNFDEVEIDLILKAEEERLASYNGVQVINSTGVRAVEFCRPDKGNYLTTSVIENLTKKIEDFENNWVANAIFLGSQSLFLFSAGVHDSDFLDGEKEGKNLDKSIQVCASRILDFPNHMISLYGGFITGTPFGMLLGSHYRLGTPSLLLCINEPTHGQLPIGGLALGFSRYSTISPVVLKYLAMSGSPIHSNELYEMGVLTHLTDHKPHRGLQYGDTILINDTKAIQPAHGEPAYLDDMIDDMDINAEMDIHSHEAWDQFLTVPVAVPEADPIEETNIKLIYSDMEPLFGHGTSLEDSVHMLIKKRESDPDQIWVNNALCNMVKCSPLALKCWYRLVDEVQGMADTYKDMIENKDKNSAAECDAFYKRSHADILALEVNINEVLRKEQIDGKWVNSNSSSKDTFDLSLYEDDPAEDVDTMEKKTLKQLTEERDSAAAALAQKEEQLNRDIQLFLDNLAYATDKRVSDIFSASVPTLELEKEK